MGSEMCIRDRFTTMAGRRLRDRVKHALIDAGAASNSSHVVIAGLANTYASYVTTHDEYQVQRYEGRHAGVGEEGCVHLLTLMHICMQCCAQVQAPSTAHGRPKHTTRSSKSLPSSLPKVQ